MDASRTLTAIVGVLVAVSAPGAFGATIRVPGDQPTIQAAIASAAGGDTVLVAPGLYIENVDFLSKSVALRSEAGPASTIIDGNLSGPVIYMQGVPVTAGVYGFTIRRGRGPFGSGISLLVASPRISGNIIAMNPEEIGYYGAGIGGNVASPEIDNNVFYGNSCDSQFLAGVIAFVNGSSPKIHDNVIRDNDCRGISMTLPVGNTPVVYNNTIVRNRAGIYIDARISNADQTFRNNVVAFNNIGLEVVLSFGPFDAVWRNNLFFGNVTNTSGALDPTGTNDNINADPRFLNAAANDFRLGPGSAAIDAADAAGLSLPTADFAGAPRLADGNGDGAAVLDIGAFEAPPPAVAVAVPVPATEPWTTALLSALVVLLAAMRLRRRAAT